VALHTVTTLLSRASHTCQPPPPKHIHPEPPEPTLSSLLLDSVLSSLARGSTRPASDCRAGVVGSGMVPTLAGGAGVSLVPLAHTCEWGDGGRER
jgi:hypothetical protein